MGIKKDIQDRLDKGEALTGKDVLMLFHGRYSAITRLRESTHLSVMHPNGYKVYFGQKCKIQYTTYGNDVVLYVGKKPIKWFKSKKEAKTWFNSEIEKCH